MLQLNNIITPRFNMLRSDADVHSNLSWSGNLAAQSKKNADFCDGTRPATSEEIWFMQTGTGPTNLSALTYEALELWAAGLVTEAPSKDPAIELITNASTRYVGCAWSRSCGPKVMSRRYIYCSFSASSQSVIEARDTGYDLTKITDSMDYIREQAEVTPYYPMTWNKDLASLALKDAELCNGQLFGDEVLYQNHNGPVSESDTVLQAIGDWYNQQGGETQAAQQAWNTITEPSYREVGCGYTASCGSNTFLYCKFGPPSSTKALRSIDNLDMFPGDTNDFDFANYTQTLVNWYFRISKAKLDLRWNDTLLLQANTSANECDDCEHVDTVVYKMAYNTSAAANDEVLQIDTAITQWMHNETDTNLISDPKYTDMGCSWGYCNTTRYLDCAFWGDNTNGL